MKEYTDGAKMPFLRRLLVLLNALLFLILFAQGWGTSNAATPGQSSMGAGLYSPDAPNATCAPDNQCFADVAPGSAFFDFVNRLYQQDLVTGYACGGTGEPCDQYNRPYYRPSNGVSRQQMAKFVDNARHLSGIRIETNTDVQPMVVGSSAANSTSILGYGVACGVMGQTEYPGGYALFGQQDTNDPSATGAAVRAIAITAMGVSAYSSGNTAVMAQSNDGPGVYASSVSNTGVWGVSTDATGVIGDSTTGTGVLGTSTISVGTYGYSGSFNGVYGESDSGNGVFGISTSGYAGSFEGNVNVTGTCCQASAGSYRIDDPTDPSNKYLYHSAVESSEMLDIYTGHVTLDADGEAWVDMPSWFQALNEDFNYQLTCVGGYAPVYVAQEIKNNRFKIAGGKPGLKVSWQVTGVRHDPYAEQNRVPTQQDKPANEQGTYLHPELYGQPQK